MENRSGPGRAHRPRGRGAGDGELSGRAVFPAVLFEFADAHPVVLAHGERAALADQPRGGDAVLRPAGRCLPRHRRVAERIQNGKSEDFRPDGGLHAGCGRGGKNKEAIQPVFPGAGG